MKSLAMAIFLAFSQATTTPDILLPDTVKAQVGSFIPITAQTKGEVVRFVALDPGLNVFPSNLLSDKKTTVVVATQNGRYRILAYTSINNVPTEPAFTTVVVGDVNPTPPNPGPGPNPTPPGPNVPDEFADSIKSIFGGLQEPDKADSAKKLAQVYELAVLEVDNPKYSNLGQLYSAVRAISFQNIKADKLNPIREVIANELDKVVGTDPNIKLDDATKKKIKGQFNRVAKILGGLNG
jgi:hypothetical protein